MWVHDVDPHVTQQCLGPPHAPPQMAAPTVEALSHTYAVNSPLVTMARSKFAPTAPLPVDQSPNRTNCFIPGPVRAMMPNGIRIRSAVCPQCTGQIDAPTDRPTDRPRKSLTTIGRYASNESGAAIGINYRLLKARNPSDVLNGTSMLLEAGIPVI